MKRLLLATGAALALVILAIAPAQAATWQSHRADPVGDISRNGHKPSARQIAQTDIVSVAYGRGSARVWFRVQVRDLVKSINRPEVDLQYGNDGVGYTMAWYPRHAPTLSSPAGNLVCKGRGAGTVNYSADTIQVGFPKSCFMKSRVLWHPWISTSYMASGWSSDISDYVGPLPSFVPNP